MKTLVCFFEKNLLVKSTDYELLVCKENESVTEFLKKTEATHEKQMKIIQVNFEYAQENLFQTQQALYPAAKAHVFVLNSYELLSETEWLQTIGGKLR